ncbi:MAG: TetR/AcrR family transcriptional regulator [Candidatus Nanopelagicales bacterium]|nr:TetR/AcrR family transcriptional regulator [Candidatus Nanopelagicales bacterium]
MPALTARGQATRDRLVAAARDVFAERGFAGTRMSDLADAAGVAHGTVYTYFDTKEEVLLAVLAAVRQDLHAAMTMPTVHDPVARIEGANRAYLDGYRSHAQLLRVAQEAAAGDGRFADVLRELRDTHVRRVAAAIRKLQAEGIAAPDVDAHTAAAALCGMVEGFAAHWLGRGEAHDEALANRTLTQLWVRGLGLRPRTSRATGAPRADQPGRPTAAQPAAPRSTAAAQPAAARRPAGPPPAP